MHVLVFDMDQGVCKIEILFLDLAAKGPDMEFSQAIFGRPAISECREKPAEEQRMRHLVNDG